MPVWLLDLRIWLAAAAAAATLWGYVQTTRLVACQADLRAERAQVAVLAGRLELQNKAVDELQALGRKRAEEAAKALATAREEAGRAKSQADALERALAQRRATAGVSRPPGKAAGVPEPVKAAPAGSSCPAGDAVQELRRALAGR